MSPNDSWNAPTSGVNDEKYAGRRLSRSAWAGLVGADSPARPLHQELVGLRVGVVEEVDVLGVTAVVGVEVLAGVRANGQLRVAEGPGNRLSERALEGFDGLRHGGERVGSGGVGLVAVGENVGAVGGGSERVGQLCLLDRDNVAAVNRDAVNDGRDGGHDDFVLGVVAESDVASGERDGPSVGRTALGA